MGCNEILYNIIQFIHVYIWIFTLFAWLCKTTALVNILIVIPIIYITQISPWCLPNKIKSMLCPDKYKKNIENGGNQPVAKFREKVQKFSAFNPLSYQGMLILSYITCVFSLYFKGYIKID